MESKVNVVTIGYSYIGVGIQQRADKVYIVKQKDTTLQECLQLCETRRMKDPTLNGVLRRRFDGLCEILKNDQGHDSTYSTYTLNLHFRA